MKTKTKKVLVVGASGATGRLLVKQLLDRDIEVNAIVRSTENFPVELKDSGALNLIKANLLDLTDEELRQTTKGCEAILSCLGHNLTWKGIYGNPRRLVRDAVMQLTKAAKENNPDKPVRFILMNTTGNRNRDLNEPIPFGNRIVIGLLRLLLPPHPDNEQAADYLRTEIGQSDPKIEWVAVRPDNLIDETEVTEYEVYPSPIRNPIFSSGKTSRINVGNFMAILAIEDDIWSLWKGRMPVIYNMVHG